MFGVLKWLLFKGADVADKVIAFLPLESMSNLIVEPISRLGAIKTLGSQLGEGFTKNYAVQWEPVLIVLCWTFIFIWLSYVILKKRDL